jgi:SAM-dependent methyltransferase
MAKVQDILALIDGTKSCWAHNLAGRIVGSIPKPYNPLNTINNAAKILRNIETATMKKAGGGGDVFFEYGTGWVPSLPIGFWLGGADRTITIDTNPYMQNTYVKEAAQIIAKNDNKIKEIYGNLLDEKRLTTFVNYVNKNKIKVKDLLELCRIEYIAPADAARTNLADASVDHHVSHFAFEHIPPETLKSILLEGARIIKSNGLFINSVDYQDHFAVYTKSANRLNFLCYSDKDWRKYNNNKYTYVNRLRHQDFIKMFEELGHDIVYVETIADENVKKLLDNGVELDEKYKFMPKETLSIMNAWFVTRLKPENT